MEENVRHKYLGRDYINNYGSGFDPHMISKILLKLKQIFLSQLRYTEHTFLCKYENKASAMFCLHIWLNILEILHFRWIFFLQVYNNEYVS